MRNSLQLVNETWEQKEQQSGADGELMEYVITKSEQLNNEREAIEAQMKQYQERHQRTREQLLKRVAELQGDSGLIRALFPDQQDPVVKLLDSALDFLTQLQEVAKHPPALAPDLLATVLSVNAVVIRSALQGISWPVEEKITQVSELARTYDQSIENKPNNNTIGEETHA